MDISASGANKRVRLAQPHFQARLNRDDGFSLDYDDTFYVLNAFEELDSPGEWYLNRATNKVYYYPGPGEDVNQAGAYVPVVETLVNVAGSSPSAKASAIAFDGITFEHGNWMLPRDRFIGGSQAEAQYADDPFNGSQLRRLRRRGARSDQADQHRRHHLHRTTPCARWAAADCNC